MFAVLLLWSFVALSLSSSSADGLQEGRVPQVLQEVFDNITRSGSSSFYTEANYVRAFQGHGVDNLPCPAVAFPMPDAVPTSQAVSGELRIFHKLSGEMSRSLTPRQMKTAYQVKVCVRNQFGVPCHFLPEISTVTPVFVGWLKFTVSADISSFLLEQQGVRNQGEALQFDISVYFNSNALVCDRWPLQFVMSESQGVDFAPLYTVYTQAENTFLHSLLVKDIKKPREQDEEDGVAKGNSNLDAILRISSRKKRSVSSRSSTSAPEKTRSSALPTATPAPTEVATTPHLEEVPPPSTETPPQIAKPKNCSLHSWVLPADAFSGWVLYQLPNIGHCSGFCWRPFLRKDTSPRARFITEVALCGYIPLSVATESCYPSRFVDQWVLMYSKVNGIFRLYRVKDLKAVECSCAL